MRPSPGPLSSSGRPPLPLPASRPPSRPPRPLPRLALPRPPPSILEAQEFEWESQLRFYWDRDPDELNIRQCTGTFGYGYEYMGLNGRLVITALTDRIYLTLTQVTAARALAVTTAPRRRIFLKA